MQVRAARAEDASSLAALSIEVWLGTYLKQGISAHFADYVLETLTAELLDFARLTEHRNALIEGELAFRPLFRSVVMSPEYRAATDAGLPGTQVPLKMVTPGLLASQMEDLTGFRWTGQGWDLVQSDQFGFLTLAGGADGAFVTKHSRGPNVTLLLVQERLAEASAAYVVTEDLSSDSPRLFDRLSPDTHVDDDPAGAAAQLQGLHRRIFGTTIAADGPEVEANLALWHDLFAIEGEPAAAWAGVLTALLRDPDLLLY